MAYDIILTGRGEFTGNFNYLQSFVTTLSGDIDLFGVRVGTNDDISLAQITSISGNEFTWQLPLSDDLFPSVGFNVMPTYALFIDNCGNLQELSANITAYRREEVPANMLYDFIITASGEVDYVAAFESTLPKEIVNFGLKIGMEYDISNVEILDVTDKTYEWEVPFSGSEIANIGPNDIPFHAAFIDVCGNFQEISGNVVAYKISDLVATRDYYIQLQANINKDIYQNENGDFGINGAMLNKEEESYDICYNLPEGQANMIIKTIQVRDAEENIIGSIDLILELKTKPNGEIQPRVFFQGETITTDISDDLLTAQIAYFSTAPDGSITIDATGSDSLTASLTPDSAKNLFPQQIEALEALYSGNVLTDWKMEILKANAEPFSIVNQVYAETGRTKSLPNFFNEGESITLTMGHDLELSVKDLNGNDVEVIPTTMIYAIVTQNSSAKPLNP